MMFNFHNFLRAGLSVFILALPFQRLPESFGFSVYALRYSDEILGLFGFVLGLMVFATNKRKLVPHFFIYFIIFVLFFVFVSVLHGSNIEKASFVLFEFGKIFFPAMISFFIGWSYRDLIVLCKGITLVAVLLAAVGLVGIVLAKFTGSDNILVAQQARFFGLNRLISLTGNGNWNYLGLYFVLAFFLLPVWNSKNYRRWMGGVILFGLFLTQSRQAILGFLVMALVFAPFKQKKIFIIGSIFVGVLTVSIFWELFAPIFLLNASVDPDNYFRLYSFVELMKTFFDHPFFGMGPGTAGSQGSILFESDFYYTWPKYFHEFAIKTNGVDQFWTVILAELGFFGFGLYFAVYVRLLIDIFNSSKNFGLAVFDKLGMSLMGYMIALWIMGFFGGLNSAFVTWSYFGLAGAYLSVAQNNNGNLQNRLKMKNSKRYSSIQDTLFKG